MNKYDVTPILQKIEPAAFSFFREWTKAATKDFPDMDFTIKDESILVKDLTNSIHSALASLNEKEEQSHFLSWKIGFFKGFVGSNLNLHWYHEYIHKQSHEYRVITMLQSINKYLMVKENAREEIDTVYLNSLESNSNLRNIDSEILITRESIMDQMIYPELGLIKQQFQYPAVTCLDNIITAKINKFVKQDNKKYLPDIDSYFTEDEIAVLIKINNKDSPNE